MPRMQLTAAYCHCVALQAGCCALPTHTAGFWCSMHHLMIIVCDFGDGAIVVGTVCLLEGQGGATHPAWRGPISVGPEEFWG